MEHCFSRNCRAKSRVEHLVTGLVVAVLGGQLGCGDNGSTGANDATGGAGGDAQSVGGADNPGGQSATGGSATAGSSGAAQGGDGAMAGDNAGGGGTGGRMGGGCSEDDLRTAPPPGKEGFAADPIDDTFPYSSHWMGEWGADDSRFMGMTAFADLDNDGDLDFSAGQRHDVGGGQYWWEYCTPDHWVRHRVGDGHRSFSSGDAMDVDGDGWIDLVVGDSWYKNPQNPREADEWERIAAGPPAAEELIIGDITGDGKPEVLFTLNDYTPQWWSPAGDPNNWTKGIEFGSPIQQGSAWGDIDGDGDNDYILNKNFWYENNGTGQMLTQHTIGAAAAFPDNQPLTYIGDLDSDGDNDYALVTHWMGQGNTARIAWVENLDGDGGDWEMHMLSETKQYSHGVIIADFDNDGDLDILHAQNVGPSYIWENTDGQGNFEEHRIVDDFRGHTPRVGDIDCDGDLDIAGGPWGDRNQSSTGEAATNAIPDYVFLRSMLVENGGTPLFERHPYETGAVIQDHCK